MQVQGLIMPLSRRGLFAAATGLAAANLAGTARAAPATGGSIWIGCITALTGPQETLGRSILNGAQIAADEINADGGALGCPLRLSKRMPTPTLDAAPNSRARWPAKASTCSADA